jgi:hypothetical protein
MHRVHRAAGKASREDGEPILRGQYEYSIFSECGYPGYTAVRGDNPLPDPSLLSPTFSPKGIAAPDWTAGHRTTFCDCDCDFVSAPASASQSPQVPASASASWSCPGVAPFLSLDYDAASVRVWVSEHERSGSILR